MASRLLIRVRDGQQAPVVPHAAEERDADRVAAGEVAGRYRDLRQAGGSALLARAGLGAIALGAAFVRVRTGLVGGVEPRVELVCLHGVHQHLAERLAAGDEVAGGGIQRRARRHGTQGIGEAPLAGRRHLT